MTEGKFMSYSLAAVIFLIAIHLFHSQLLTIYNPLNYLGFHTILELFSISISASIFFISMRMFKKNQLRSSLLLGATFFLVGMIDVLHTLTFKGMPFFFSESSIPKATWFWVIARVIEAVFILVLLLVPDRKISKKFGPITFLFCTSFIISIAFFIFQSENHLPALVIEGKGTTLLKNTIEYFVSFLHFVAMVLVLYRYYIDKKEDHLYQALAFTLLFLSELIFTIYKSVYDLDNFSGHIFKVIGYYFIMKGFLFIPTSVKKIELETVPESALRKILHEQEGIIFKFIKVDEDFIHTFCDGELLKTLDISQSSIVDKSIQEFIPVEGEYIIKYYSRAWHTGEIVRFTVVHNQLSLFVVLKPLTKDGAVYEVIGSVIDITSSHLFNKQVSNI
jgi:PAS domain-containing protein